MLVQKKHDVVWCLCVVYGWILLRFGELVLWPQGGDEFGGEEGDYPEAEVTLADRLRWGEAPKREPRAWWKGAQPLEPKVRINTCVKPLATCLLPARALT